MTTSNIWEQRINNLGRWMIKHWLLLFNGLALLYAGLPWLSPLAKVSGHPFLGQILFSIYTPLCHQRPERSFFLYGYQVAYCHRCTALYTAILAVGLLFALLRRRIKPISMQAGALLLLPMLLDGGTHLIDDLLGATLRGGGDAVGTLNFWLRMATGLLVGLAVLLAVYPRLERELRSPNLIAATSS